MPYKYKKKKYYKKKSYQKYDPYEDIAMLWAILIIFFWIYITKIYQENPILIYLWFGIVIFAIVVFSWFLVLKQRRKYLKTKTLNQMKDMDWREFEKFIAFVFTKKWFRAKVWKWRNDWWIDVTATKNWQKYLIQCKKWNNYKIGSEELQKFVWAMDGEWENIIWIFITTSRLTKPAQVYLEKVRHKLELWDADNLEEYVRGFTWKKEIHHIQEEVLEAHHEILCKRCGSVMVLREAHRWTYKGNKFYGCSTYPECSYKITFPE